MNSPFLTRALASIACMLPSHSLPSADITAALYGHALASIPGEPGQWTPLVVGAPGYSHCDECAGFIEIVHGRTEGKRVAGRSAGDRFGFSLAVSMPPSDKAGKIVLVGAPQAGIIGRSAGTGYLAAVSTADGTITWTIDGHDTGDQYGFAVSAATSASAKSGWWAVVGAPQSEPSHEGGTIGAGYVEAINLKSKERRWTRRSPQIGSRYGFAVTCADDLDADGVQEVVVGSPSHVIDGVSCGRVEALFGSSGEPAWEVSKLEGLCGLGRALCVIDDRDGDGVRDIAVCASNTGLVSPADRSESVALLSGRTGTVIAMIRSPVE